jgi:hypothetical protein
MNTLQDDLLEIYNNLLAFNKNTLLVDRPIPITVRFEKESNALVFEQKGVSLRLGTPIYYSLGLNDLIKPTYLLPPDYDYLMQSLSSVITSGKLLEDRICLSPENYGFDLYKVDYNEFWKGPDIIGSIRFVSGDSWLFKLLTRIKYRLW